MMRKLVRACVGAQSRRRASDLLQALLKRSQRIVWIAGGEITDPAAPGQALPISRLEGPHINVGLDVAEIRESSGRPRLAVVKSVPAVVAEVARQQDFSVF